MIWPILGMLAVAGILWVVGRSIEAEDVKRIERITRRR